MVTKNTNGNRVFSKPENKIIKKVFADNLDQGHQTAGKMAVAQIKKELDVERSVNSVISKHFRLIKRKPKRKNLNVTKISSKGELIVTLTKTLSRKDRQVIALEAFNSL